MELPNVARGNVVRTIDDLRNMVSLILDDYEKRTDVEKSDLAEALERNAELYDRLHRVQVENMSLREQLSETRELYKELYQAYTCGKKKMSLLHKHRKALRDIKRKELDVEEILDDDIPF